MEPISKSLKTTLQASGNNLSPTSNSRQSTQDSVKLAKTAIAVERIFKGRPEIRTENDNYLAGLTETLKALTPQELEWVSDIRDGIQTRCKFLPTPADIFELIREKVAARDKIKATRAAGIEYFESVCTPADLNPPKRKFNPFPKLARAFKGEPHLLERSFDCLFSASKALATDSVDAARTVLGTGHSIR